MYATKRTTKTPVVHCQGFKNAFAPPSDCDAKYITTRFILSTSNISERMFSRAGDALSDRRKRILPSNFEQQNIFAFEQGLVEYSGRKLFDRELQ